MAVGLLLSFVLLFAEPNLVDFFQKGHYNWVSLHSLAIAKHSDLAFGGVGFSCAVIRPEGEFFHDYFNRYPLFLPCSAAGFSRPGQLMPSLGCMRLGSG